MGRFGCFSGIPGGFMGHGGFFGIGVWVGCFVMEFEGFQGVRRVLICWNGNDGLALR